MSRKALRPTGTPSENVVLTRCGVCEKYLPFMSACPHLSEYGEILGNDVVLDIQTNADTAWAVEVYG